MKIDENHFPPLSPKNLFSDKKDYLKKPDVTDVIALNPQDFDDGISHASKRM